MDSYSEIDSQSRKTALVVDDDQSVRRVFLKGLQSGGFNVDTAETAKEALKKIKDRAYDVTLIDMELPDMNGLNLLGAMKAASYGMTKIIVTGDPTAEDGLKALEMGADAYLAKPVKREELLKIIRKNLEKEEPFPKEGSKRRPALRKRPDLGGPSEK